MMGDTAETHGDPVEEQSEATKVSRASMVKLGAVGVAGAVGAALAAPKTAKADTTDTYFLAKNSGASQLNAAFQVSTAIPGYFNGLIAQVGGGYAVYAENRSQTSEALVALTIGDADGLKGGSTGRGNGVRGVAGGGDGHGVVGEAPGGAGDGVHGSAAGGGDGVHGEIATGAGHGVHGVTAGTGYGVHGEATGTSDGVHGKAVAGNGVSGTASALGVSGVYGENTSSGYGVAGRCGTDGTAVYADAGFTGSRAIIARAPNTIAVDARGAIVSDRSGVVTIKGTSAAPKSTIRVTPTGQALTAASLLLATIQTNNAPGTFVQSAVPNLAGSFFTITLNQPVIKFVKIAWFILN